MNALSRCAIRNRNLFLAKPETPMLGKEQVQYDSTLRKSETVWHK
jgi:hypothetical protein